MIKKKKKQSLSVKHVARLQKKQQHAAEQERLNLQAAYDDQLETMRCNWARANANLKQQCDEKDAQIRALQSHKERIDANTKLLLAAGQMLAMVTDNLRD